MGGGGGVKGGGGGSFTLNQKEQRTLGLFRKNSGTGRGRYGRSLALSKITAARGGGKGRTSGSLGLEY